MDIQVFTEIMQQAAKSQNVSLRRYETEFDFRFGIPETYVAASFEQNSSSTVIEFRVGNVGIFVNKFNALHMGSAQQHYSSKDMLEVRINNGHFNEEVITLVKKCADRAVIQYINRRR